MKNLSLLLLFGTALAGFPLVVRGQDAECTNVDLQLNAVLGLCPQGVETCLVNADLFAKLVCVDTSVGLSQLNIFVGCKGSAFGDQIFATLCTDGDPKCYERVRSNNGMAAYSACCGATDTSCSTECSDELSSLTSTLTCCTQTSPYIEFFSTCRGSSLSMQQLYDTCGLQLPKPCPHLFTIRTPDIQPMCQANSSTFEQKKLSLQCQGYLTELERITVSSSQSELRAILDNACTNDCLGSLCSYFVEQTLQTECADNLAGLCSDARKSVRCSGLSAVVPAISFIMLTLTALLVVGMTLHL